MTLTNDERGWVMTCLSGIACVFGASIICVDIIVRQFPGKKQFKIQDSDTFLSASLSLSFGVMLFSALYSMLPSAKRSLVNGGFSPKHAAWTLIGCFLAGVVGIAIVSRILHQFIPSQVVDCEHSHEAEPAEDTELDHRESPPQQDPSPTSRRKSLPGHMPKHSIGRRESLRASPYFDAAESDSYMPVADSQYQNSQPEMSSDALSRRPTLQQRLTNSISQLASNKTSACSCDGPCFGYSDPCGQECFKNLTARGGYRAPVRTGNGTMKPAIMRSATVQSVIPATDSTPLLQDIEEEPRPQTEHIAQAPTRYFTSLEEPETALVDDSSGTLAVCESSGKMDLHKPDPDDVASSHRPEHHHHHVPTNAFLSVGLQTSIAIALHKLPEGFITYATNHANPKLGVSVFLALFIHNITEGFAMALPLYLAINSRFKAMLVAFVLGGLSQPIGAGVAAIWLHLAAKGDWTPSEAVYGGMFAFTSGIMASVALQLFSESLDLTHSRTICMVGAFSGMGILGMSSALTA